MLRRDFAALSLAALAMPGLARAEDDAPLKLRELYARDGGISETARALEGKPLTVFGYMAPPLKANSTFFVLTKMPMAVCPFCETEADWPDNILGVYTRRVFKVAPFNRGIEVSGVLSLGSYRDPDTGFLSLVRIEQARYRYA
jgi:hypothetical protein